MRLAVLSLLGEAPMHGYQVMQEITDRSGGRWQPSPGSIYPLLQQLTDEGLVAPSEEGDRKVFSLTDAGREAAKDAAASDIWQRSTQMSGHDLRDVMGGVFAATRQIGRTGTSEQVAAAETILEDARKKLYLLLAEG